MLLPKLQTIVLLALSATIHVRAIILPITARSETSLALDAIENTSFAPSPVDVSTTGDNPKGSNGNKVSQVSAGTIWVPKADDPQGKQHLKDSDGGVGWCQSHLYHCFSRPPKKSPPGNSSGGSGGNNGNGGRRGPGGTLPIPKAPDAADHGDVWFELPGPGTSRDRTIAAQGNTINLRLIRTLSGELTILFTRRDQDHRNLRVHAYHNGHPELGMFPPESNLNIPNGGTNSIVVPGTNLSRGGATIWISWRLW